jgi:hypothetical protein
MQLDTLTPDMPELLAEMGVNYNPEKLADSLSTRKAQVRLLAGEHSRAVLCMHQQRHTPRARRCTAVPSR